jgi:parallel beta-helix repeat protein
MKTLLALSIILSGILPLGLNAVFAATYWFSTGGGAANCAAASGTSDPGVYRTFSQALACLAAGDTAIGKAGTYSVRILDQVPSGTSNAARTIVKSEVPLGVVIRPGTGGSLWGINAARSYITIDGFDLDGVNCRAAANGKCGGFFTSGGSLGTHTNITFQNGRIRNMGADGISTSNTDNFQVLNTIFTTVGMCDGVDAGYCHGIYIGDPTGTTFSSYITISGNYFDGCGGYCIHVYNEPTPHQGVIVTRNFMKNCGTLANQSCTVNYSNNSVFAYNVAKDGGEAGFLQRSGGPVLYHNNTAHSSGAGIQIEGGSGIVCRNNLLLDNGVGFSGSCGTSSNNVTGTAAANVVNGASDRFDLLSSSACVNAGVASIGAITLNGATVNVTAVGNGLPDCGAFETFVQSQSEIGTVNASTITIDFQSAYAPLLPTSGCTGWSATVNSVARSLSACARQGNAQYRLTLASPAAGGETIQWSYNTSGAVTDSALIGASLNQRLNALGPITATNNISGGGGAVFAVEHFRCRDWDKSIALNNSRDWLGAEDAACTVRNDGGGKIAIANLISCNVADCAVRGFRFYESYDGGGYVAITNSFGSNKMRYDNTQAGAAHGTPITSARLTNPEPAFIAGGVTAQDSSFPNIDLAQNSATEIQGHFELTAGVTAGKVICVQPRLDDGTNLTHNQTACFTVQPPAGTYQ